MKISFFAEYWLMKAFLIIHLEWMDPLVGRLPGDAETLCQLRYRGLVQLVFFEESLPLFRQGNTFPGHVLHLLHEISVTHVFGICVTDVLKNFCNLWL
jgi:hypothetical protein